MKNVEIRKKKKEEEGIIKQIYAFPFKLLVKFYLIRWKLT